MSHHVPPDDRRPDEPDPDWYPLDDVDPAARRYARRAPDGSEYVLREDVERAEADMIMDRRGVDP